MLPIVIPLRAEEDRDWKVQPTPLRPLTISNYCVKAGVLMTHKVRGSIPTDYHYNFIVAGAATSFYKMEHYF